MANQAKTKPSTGYSSETQTVKGILIDRDPPITAGWCGNDNCEHITHKERRAAQAAADKRAKH
jgi:hypothetical protein